MSEFEMSNLEVEDVLEVQSAGHGQLGSSMGMGMGTGMGLCLRTRKIQIHRSVFNNSRT